MWKSATEWLWRVAYRRVVFVTFRTVPLYREFWALSGRTDPQVVAGRSGVNGGAVPVAEVLRRAADLVPLSGGVSHVDSGRGFGRVLAATGDRVVRPRGGPPADPAARRARVPHRALTELTAGPGVLHDDTLGYLAGFRPDCGSWHVDWPRVYVRATAAGLAFTLLRQRSPRLVDVLVGDGVPGEVAWCQRHGTPVVRT